MRRFFDSADAQNDKKEKVPRCRGTFGSDVVHGVDRGTVIEDGEVQVGTGASAGGAHVADELALLDGIALVHHGAGHVGIQAGVAVTVVDGDIVAVGAAVGIDGDLAAAGGVDGSALVIGQVHAVVELILTGGGVDAVAVGRGQLDPGAGSAPALAGDEAAAAGVIGAAVVAGATGIAGTAVVTAGVAGLLVGLLLLLLFPEREQVAKPDAPNAGAGDGSFSEQATASKIKDNDPCPCGSGKKYKKCCKLKEN